MRRAGEGGWRERERGGERETRGSTRALADTLSTNSVLRRGMGVTGGGFKAELHRGVLRRADPTSQRERIFIERMASDCKLKASKEGLK